MGRRERGIPFSYSYDSDTETNEMESPDTGHFRVSLLQPHVHQVGQYSAGTEITGVFPLFIGEVA